MAKGIIYVMTTVVPGLIKIGKTGSGNFEQRMSGLERNGYSNVVGLKRHFAIEVEDYDEKEILLDDIFSKSRLENTELFALDVNLVVQLLSSFEGKQIYPETISKEEVFDEATIKRDMSLIPEGEYYFDRKIKRWENNHVKGTMRIEDGKFIVQKGSTICPIESAGNSDEVHEKRRTAKIKDNILQEDVETSSPSAAGGLLIGSACNGWVNWKNKDGKHLDYYRRNKSE